MFLKYFCSCITGEEKKILKKHISVWTKFIADMKELGTIVTINEGPAEVDKAKEIDYSKFNELRILITF